MAEMMMMMTTTTMTSHQLIKTFSPNLCCLWPTIYVGRGPGALCYVIKRKPRASQHGFCGPLVFLSYFMCVVYAYGPM